MGTNNNATEDVKSLEMKFFVGGVLHNKQDTLIKGEFVRVPAEIEEMEKDSFVLHVPVKSHDVDSEESIASTVKIVALASQGVSELMPLWQRRHGVLMKFLENMSSEKTQSISGTPSIAMNQAEKPEKFSGLHFKRWQ